MVENAGEISVYDQSAAIGIVKIYLETLEGKQRALATNLRIDKHTKMTKSNNEKQQAKHSTDVL